MTAKIFQNLLDVGDSMKNALDEGDFDAYFELVEERGTLVDALHAYRHPSEIDADWEEWAEALSTQQAALIEAAVAQQRRLQDAISRIERVRNAQRSYLEHPGRSNILNENLRV